MKEGDFSAGGSTHRLGIYCSTNCNFPLVRAGQPVNLSRAASCGHGGVGPRRKSSSGIAALLKLIHCKNLASIYFFPLLERSFQNFYVVFRGLLLCNTRIEICTAVSQSSWTCVSEYISYEHKCPACSAVGARCKNKNICLKCSLLPYDLQGKCCLYGLTIRRLRNIPLAGSSIRNNRYLACST